MSVSCARSPSGKDSAAHLEADRRRMVREQLVQRGIDDARVLAAISEVPRHEFVPASEQEDAYSDQPLPIGREQTISQPYIVALMTQVLNPKPQDRILEIGTGSGYQAAVLSKLAGEVYTIEIDPELAAEAKQRLADLGYGTVEVRTGDGFYGWPEAAPFDGIIVTAATPRVPEALVRQLRDGGRLIMPLGSGSHQQLMVGTKKEGRLSLVPIRDVLFVPMTGAVREPIQSFGPAGPSAAPTSPEPLPSAR